ncbi:MAG: hypothetical protein ACE14L_18030 [Terriglobales bacterium]
MSTHTILLLQSILIFLQMVNAALGVTLHVSPAVAVLLSAFVGAFQFYVNHVGNQTQPPAK